MDTADWSQFSAGGGGSSSRSSKGNHLLERRARPQKDQALNCPRCNSANTKFCYYNNYSLSQPRYFCKACRRYWTEGGSLRDVPVGGGSRKNRRSSLSSSSSADDRKIDTNHPIPASSATSSHLLGSFMAANGGGGDGFGLLEMKPSCLSFSLEGFETGGGGYGDHHHHHQDQTAVMFPAEDLKQSNGATEFEQNRGYWNGMVGGGSW